MAQSVVVVDAFTDRAFSGNPAAVCVMAAAADDGWMQRVAREMNLSETAFVFPETDGFRLRWFTPTMEVELCGHATLASAHVLWESGQLAEHEMARFHTRSGVLTAERRGSLVIMDFPAVPEEKADAPAGLLEALGVRAVYVGKNKFDYLVEVENEVAVRALQPDLAAIARIPARGVMVTSRASTADVDFVSRFFGPAAGVPEDPVTGSAHCCLGPYWASRLHKTTLLAQQVSARGGIVHLEIQNDRVQLGGQAVTVMRGELQH